MTELEEKMFQRIGVLETEKHKLIEYLKIIQVDLPTHNVKFELKKLGIDFDG